jgi:sugar lactone lactonase YvrE
MYRIKTEYLLDESLFSGSARGKSRESRPGPRSLTACSKGAKGIVYLTAIEENAIARFDPRSRNTMVVVQDTRLQWPDTMAWGPDGRLYVTTSQIHRMPKYHGGVSKQHGPYMVYRMKLP